MSIAIQNVPVIYAVFAAQQISKCNLVNLSYAQSGGQVTRATSPGSIKRTHISKPSGTYKQNSVICYSPKQPIHKNLFHPLHERTHKPFSRAELQRLTIIINSCINDDCLFFIKQHTLVMNPQQTVLKWAIHRKLT